MRAGAPSNGASLGVAADRAGACSASLSSSNARSEWPSSTAEAVVSATPTWAADLAGGWWASDDGADSDGVAADVGEGTTAGRSIGGSGGGGWATDASGRKRESDRGSAAELDRPPSDWRFVGRRSGSDAREAVRDLSRRPPPAPVDGPAATGWMLKKMLRGVMLSELSGTTSSVAGASSANDVSGPDELRGGRRRTRRCQDQVERGRAQADAPLLAPGELEQVLAHQREPLLVARKQALLPQRRERRVVPAARTQPGRLKRISNRRLQGTASEEEDDGALV